MDEELMKQLALLQALHDEENRGIFVSSLEDAYRQLVAHLGPTDGKFRRELVAFITDPENRVFSECDVYHNFIMALFRAKDYDLGLQVCDFALARAPYNRDILGDAIRACGNSSQFDRAEPYLERAREIPLELWSFRLFLYTVDYYKTKLDAYPLDEGLYQQALELADRYIQVFPFDEHGYNQKAELLLQRNHRQEAVSLLREFIFETRPDKGDSRSELVTAQCCTTLLNILDDSNDYDFIIQICEKGLRNTTQEQPSASIGNFVYRKAMALDAKAHTEGFRVPQTVRDALRFYQAAYDLNQDRDYAQTIEQRYAVLRPYAAEFAPLVKRSLFVTEGAPQEE